VDRNPQTATNRRSAVTGSAGGTNATGRENRARAAASGVKAGASWSCKKMGNTGPSSAEKTGGTSQVESAIRDSSHTIGSVGTPATSVDCVPNAATPSKMTPSSRYWASTSSGMFSSTRREAERATANSPEREITPPSTPRVSGKRPENPTKAEKRRIEVTAGASGPATKRAVAVRSDGDRPVSAKADSTASGVGECGFTSTTVSARYDSSARVEAGTPQANASP